MGAQARDRARERGSEVAHRTLGEDLVERRGDGESVDLYRETELVSPERSRR